MAGCSPSAADYVGRHLEPTLSKALVALVREKPADPVTYLAQQLLALRPPPPTELAPVQGDVLVVFEDNVPLRTRRHFKSLDLNGDHRISKDEILVGLESQEFPELTPHAREAVPALWEAYARREEGGSERFLDLPLFNSMYAAMLFASFDASNTGWLSAAEATNALDFMHLREKDCAYAFPAGAYVDGELRLGPDWFWMLFQRMR